MAVAFLTTTMTGEGGIARSARSVSAGIASITVELDAIEGGGRPNKFLAASRAWSALRRRARTGDTLLLWHIHLLPLVVLSRWRGPVVVFLHGIEVWLPLRWSVASCLSRVTAFAHNSDHTWETFLRHNPVASAVPHRRVWLGLGQPIERIPRPGPAAAGVIVARVEASEGYKGHRELIEVWPRVLTSIPSAKLWIVGTGSGIAALQRRVAALKVEDYVIFEGLCSEDRKEELLRESRALLMPSRGEGFGLVYVEAMRLGRPCLVSREDAGREVVDPPAAGLAVDPTDAEAVATAVVRLLADGPEWEEWSYGARKRYEAHFTETAFLDRLRGTLAEFSAS